MSIDWIVACAGYGLGWLWTARSAALYLIDQEAQRELSVRESWEQRFKKPHENHGQPLVSSENRGMDIVLGAVIGMVWPVVLVVGVFMRGLTSPTEARELDRKKAEAFDRRTAEIEQIAEENGLPMPKVRPDSYHWKIGG